MADQQLKLDLDEEQWRPIPSRPRYMASSHGRVRKDDKIVVLRLAGNGYLQAGQFAVHTAVALTFHGPRPPSLDVRHLDGNKLNNRADNLAYGTRRENMADAILHGWNPKNNKIPTIRGSDHWLAKVTECDVITIRRSTERTTVLAERYGVSWAAINNIRDGITWTHVDPPKAVAPYDQGLCGEDCPHSKLTERDVKIILASTESSIKLAPRFNVSSRTIRYIRQGKIWKSVI